ncbi:hypothetical protein CGRA01v4_11879 [Colletotrichum graminicola]|nr:hypothetical protein CGRA01v4_11879 [Colletotrichum graminicola]
MYTIPPPILLQSSWAVLHRVTDQEGICCRSTLGQARERAWSRSVKETTKRHRFGGNEM